MNVRRLLLLAVWVATGVTLARCGSRLVLTDGDPTPAVVVGGPSPTSRDRHAGRLERAARGHGLRQPHAAAPAPHAASRSTPASPGGSSSTRSRWS